jgi:pyridoxine/pyridoxamine 5'-phosphate oxidase
MNDMTRTELLLFLQRHFLGVIATVSPQGVPEAAVVGIATTQRFELIFDTLVTTRKAINLRHSPKVACVVGWDEEQTVQYEGIADEPSGLDLERLKRHYFAQFSDGPLRQSWPGIAYFRVKPTYVRYSDFREHEPLVVEFKGHELAAIE